MAERGQSQVHRDQPGCRGSPRSRDRHARNARRHSASRRTATSAILRKIAEVYRGEVPAGRPAENRRRGASRLAAVATAGCASSDTGRSSAPGSRGWRCPAGCGCATRLSSTSATSSSSSSASCWRCSGSRNTSCTPRRQHQHRIQPALIHAQTIVHQLDLALAKAPARAPKVQRRGHRPAARHGFAGALRGHHLSCPRAAAGRRRRHALHRRAQLPPRLPSGVPRTPPGRGCARQHHLHGLPFHRPDFRRRDDGLVPEHRPQAPAPRREDGIRESAAPGLRQAAEHGLASLARTARRWRRRSKKSSAGDLHRRPHRRGRAGGRRHHARATPCSTSTQLTGESAPAEKTVGDAVFASTVMLAGKIIVRGGARGQGHRLEQDQRASSAGPWLTSCARNRAAKSWRTRPSLPRSVFPRWPPAAVGPSAALGGHQLGPWHRHPHGRAARACSPRSPSARSTASWSRTAAPSKACGEVDTVAL